MLLLIIEAISPADILLSIVLKLISKYYTTLEYLDISNCSLEETRLLSLLALVQNMIFLQHLCLNSTKITTQLAEAVAGILCNSYKYMNYLSLQKCELSASHIKIIAKALKKCQVLLNSLQGDLFVADLSTG